jgi:G protein-coupled receptor kinase interacting protein 2
MFMMFEYFLFRTNGYADLADRLIELQYELTDRLICFIGGKRPDHKTNQHILLPEINEK